VVGFLAVTPLSLPAVLAGRLGGSGRLAGATIRGGFDGWMRVLFVLVDRQGEGLQLLISSVCVMGFLREK